MSASALILVDFVGMVVCCCCGALNHVHGRLRMAALCALAAIAWTVLGVWTAMIGAGLK